jgi:galactokinase
LEDFEKYCHHLPPRVEKRARHVVGEIARTKEAKTLLISGDIATFGRLMNECHCSLRDLYEVSCPELDAMVAIAQSLDGCFGARLTGAGFGGSTVNLVESGQVERFVAVLTQDYQTKTGGTADVYISRACAGAGILG